MNVVVVVTLALSCATTPKSCIVVPPHSTTKTVKLCVQNQTDQVGYAREIPGQPKLVSVSPNVTACP